MWNCEDIAEIGKAVVFVKMRSSLARCYFLQKRLIVHFCIGLRLTAMYQHIAAGKTVL